MLSEHNLTAKSMIMKNLKIQMLAGNNLKMCVDVSFEISSTLVPTATLIIQGMEPSNEPLAILLSYYATNSTL